MRNKTVSILKKLASVALLLAVWQISAIAVDHPFLLPDIPDTLLALSDLIVQKTFYTALLYTFIRVLLGLTIGILFGTALAIAAYKFKFIEALTSPIVSVIKATPIASIIIILYVIMSGNALAVFIGILMVFPIVWQNLKDGFDAVPHDLSEICLSYEIPFSKRLRILYLPTLMKYFIPAAITSAGLAWKATVSAEIIAYTTNSIGQYINDAKSGYDSPTVFAWTVVIIIFSILFEALTKSLLRRCKKWL